jgi:parvulin-like peptidyl-prolyl isomerase
MGHRTSVPGFVMLLIAAALLPLGCSEKPRVVQEGPISALTVVATVDTAKILLGDVLEEYTKSTTPGSRFAPTLENGLDEVIYRTCAYLSSDNAKDIDRKELQRLARNRLHDVVINYMLQDMFTKDYVVSDATVDSVYKANINQFITRERRSVTQLLMSNNPKAWEAAGIDVSGLSKEQLEAKAKTQIDEYYSQVKNGADLNQLAAKYSHDTMSKRQNGSTGLFERGQMVPEFENVAFRLSKGAISPPFKTSYGWHILRVDQIIDSTVKPLDAELKKQIISQVTQANRSQVMSNFVDSLFANANLAWNESLLAKEPGTYDPFDWACIVNNTDTINAGILREMELLYRTGGRNGAITPDVRKQILLNKVPPYALMSVARQQGYLDRDTMKLVYQDLYRQELVGRLYRDRSNVNDKLPTDDELKRYYDQHRDDFISDKPIKVQHILFQDSVQAAEVKREAEAGADFKELAMKHYPGEADFKEEAFDLGWISEKEMGSEFYGAAWITDAGKIAGPVLTKDGWHIIKVVDRKSMKDFAAARLEIQQRIRSEAMAEANEAWIKKITRGHDIVKYEDILKQVDLTRRDRYFQLADSLMRAKAAASTSTSGS